MNKKLSALFLFFFLLKKKEDFNSIMNKTFYA